MKLEKVLDKLNSFEKNSFLKIIDGILSENPKNAKKVEEILSETDKELKNVDNINISKVFNLVQDEFYCCIKEEFTKTSNQLDILIDIISREGNALMKQDWFSRLYDKELDKIHLNVKEFKKELSSEKSNIEDFRKRDLLIYQSCLNTAYFNDELNNQDKKVSIDEQSILETLSSELRLSQEEIKLINYSILPIEKHSIDDVINVLKNIGVIFFSKKLNTIYVPDEIVRLLRKVRGKDVADRYFRRVLKVLREPEVNLICRAHGIDWKGVPIDLKIKSIINEGISFRGVLSNDVHKDDTSLTEKKKFINDLCDNSLKITPTVKGTVLEEKIDNLVNYFENLEKDDKVGISIDGYDSLLKDINETLPKFKDQLQQEFEFQEENIFRSDFLFDYNLKPREIVELLTEVDLKKFCSEKNISTRGDIYDNILENYKDTENLLLENYENIGFRNLSELKTNGINIKESELGIKFEDLTKDIFSELGFDVDDNLKNQLNTSKDKADIIIKLNESDVILVECKTIKEKGYNKFSAVSRQLKAYSKRVNSSDYNVVKSLLVAPDFSDDFIKDCGLEYELNLSLIKASTLFNILHGFRESRLNKFPHNLLMRDVLIEADRVLKAIDK
ncbi:MAG: hypothetical protein WED10_10915 [Brumimicrobium sp.]